MARKISFLFELCYELFNRFFRSPYFRSGVVPVLVFVALAGMKILPVQAATTLVVDTSSDDLLDDGLCSLREAITAANTNTSVDTCSHDGSTGIDTIAFKIPGVGVQTILVTSQLPLITEPIIIDGYTQPGASANNLEIGNNAVLLIELDGSKAGNSNGLVFDFDTANSLVRGLIINRFENQDSTSGLLIMSGDNSVVEGNFLGLGADGNTDLDQPRLSYCVISQGNNNRIGTDGDGKNDTGEQNVIADCGTAGIVIAGGNNTIIAGNYIGTNATGDGALGLQRMGIWLNDGQNHRVGTNADGQADFLERNVISGGNEFGILVYNNNNLVAGNYIGVSADGKRVLGNVSNGVFVQEQISDKVTATANLIGGSTPTARNIIAGNGDAGVFIDAGADQNEIAGNFIGLNADGELIPNRFYGIRITNSRDTHVQGNVISGEGGDGILLSNANGTAIDENLIAEVGGGATPALNVGNGIVVMSSTEVLIGGVGNTIRSNWGDGVQVRDTTSRVTIRRNSIFDNGELAIDLNNDGVTPNDEDDADVGPNGLLNTPVVWAMTPITVSNGGFLSQDVFVAGLLTTTANSGVYTIDFYLNDACDKSSSGEGQVYLTSLPLTITNNITGTFAITLTFAGDLVTPLQFVTATATDANGNTSEFSHCALTGPDNTLWTDAQRMTVLTDTIPTEIPGYLMRPGEARWYKFEVNSNEVLNIQLDNLQADFDITLYQDIGQTFAEIVTDTVLLNLIQAKYAAGVGVTPAYSPDRYSPDRYSPDAFSAAALDPAKFRNEVVGTGEVDASAQTASTQTGAGVIFAPDRYSPDRYSPDRYSPDRYSPDRYSHEKFTPYITQPISFPSAAYAFSQAASLVAVSALTGTNGEEININTWANSGDFYVRVKGYNGAYNTAQPFTLTVSRTETDCSEAGEAINGLPASTYSLTATKLFNTDPISVETLILIDSMRLGGITADSFADFAQHPYVRGAVVDVSLDERVIQANELADAPDYYRCVELKNAVANSIWHLIQLHRQAYPSLKYITIVGGDNVIPFFREADMAGIGPESQYAPPVKDNTTSQASLKLNYILSQDRYGAREQFLTDNKERQEAWPWPELAVGRLVETPAQIQGLLAAYLEADGIITPTTSLVTGYDFLYDAGQAVKDELGAATGAPVTTLLTHPSLSPYYGDGTAYPGLPKPPLGEGIWDAEQLRQALIANAPAEVMFLAAHFSAYSALAADFQTSLTTAAVLSSTTNLKNHLIFSIGCHSGYNIIDEHRVENMYPENYELDWAQTFAQKQAIFIGGTGYQYGATEHIVYNEEVYRLFARQLRTYQAGSAPAPVAVGTALVRAKQQSLQNLAQIEGLHLKSYTIPTLFGLPMFRVSFTGAYTQEVEATSVITTPSLSLVVDPLVHPTQATFAHTESGTGLYYADISINPKLEAMTKTVQVLSDIASAQPRMLTATYWKGVDGSKAIVVNSDGEKNGRGGVMVNPAVPILPTVQFNITGPGLFELRGVGFRGGSFSSQTDVIPLTGAPAMELRGVRALFNSVSAYPAQLWQINSLGGSDRLFVLPAQFQSNTASSITGTMRLYETLQLRLYYSQESLQTGPGASPPGFHRVLATSQPNQSINFSVAIGEGSASAQAVWVTYLDLGNEGAGWQSLDLTPAARNPSLWVGNLPDTQPRDLLYMVQVLGTNGMVLLDTNRGAYYQADVDPGAPAFSRVFADRARPGVQVELTDVPEAIQYGETITLTASFTIGTKPLGNASVTLALGPQSQQALTDSTGQAQLALRVVALPGEHELRAAFAGNDEYASAQIAVPRTVVNKQRTNLSVASSTDVVSATQPISVTLTGLRGRPLNQQTVMFVIEREGFRRLQPTITDIRGEAGLDTRGLAAGTYTVTAAFGTESDDWLRLDLSQLLYAPSRLVFTLVVSDIPVLGHTVLDNFNRPDALLQKYRTLWYGVKGQNWYFVRSQVVWPTSGGPVYWHKARFGPSQEAFLKFVKLDPSGEAQGLLLKVQGDTQADWRKGAIRVVYDAVHRVVVVGVWRADRTEWRTVARLAVRFTAGDQLGAQALADGRIIVFKNRVEIGRAHLDETDRAYFSARGGTIGLWFAPALNTWLDNFGGGTIVSTPTFNEVWRR